jgi:inorganic pyrophosphatase
VIGIIEAEQEEHQKKNRNDRLIAVAKQSLLYSDITHIGQLNSTVLQQIEAFFVNYQRVRDVKFTILACHGPDRALEVLRGADSRNQVASVL